MHRLATAAYYALALAGAVLSGCGGGSGSSDSERSAAQGAPVEGKRGGTPTMLWTDDVDNIDPGMRSANVNGVASEFNSQSDLAWTSLK
jgi:hypothetical protein